MKLRARITQPEFYSSGDLLRLPREIREFYKSIWAACEDSGCVENDPFELKVSLYPSPLDSDITPEVISGWIGELVKLGKLLPYQVGGKGYLWSKNFHQHQKLSGCNRPTIPLPEWIEFELYPSSRGDNRSKGERPNGKYIFHEGKLLVFIRANSGVVGEKSGKVGESETITTSTPKNPEEGSFGQIRANSGTTRNLTKPNLTKPNLDNNNIDRGINLQEGPVEKSSQGPVEVVEEKVTAPVPQQVTPKPNGSPLAKLEAEVPGFKQDWPFFRKFPQFRELSFSITGQKDAHAHLVALGVNPGKAAELLRKYSTQVKAQIEHLPFREVESPAGALIKAITEGWELPQVPKPRFKVCEECGKKIPVPLSEWGGMSPEKFITCNECRNRPITPEEQAAIDEAKRQAAGWGAKGFSGAVAAVASGVGKSNSEGGASHV